MTQSRNGQLYWGLAALVMATIVSVVVALLYADPPGRQVVTFYTDDALSVHPDDTVRVAGIIVGKVTDLALEPNQVRVRVNVDHDVFVGDQSQIEVRMLTVVGGYYVTIDSLGDVPLGNRAIPRERVTMPYSLIRTLADATKITNNVAAQPVRESIDQLQRGLVGDNTDAVTQLINAGNGIANTLERQRGQLSSILNMSDEFIAQLNNNRALFEKLTQRIAIIEETLLLYSKGFASAIDGLGEIVKRLDPFGVFYMGHRADFLARVEGVLGEFRAIADRNGLVVRVLGRIRSRMERTLDAQEAKGPPELLATDLCIPVEGTPC